MKRLPTGASLPLHPFPSKDPKDLSPKSLVPTDVLKSFFYHIFKLYFTSSLFSFFSNWPNSIF